MVKGMNYYGFKIESSRFSNYSQYLVIASDMTIAKDLIAEEVKRLVSDKDYGWTWGEPTVTEIANVKELKYANLIWR